jgi:magnesium-transporting ATPase (P-type)
VICLDKTGAITENKMELQQVYEYETGELTDIPAAAWLLSLNWNAVGAFF